MISYDTYGSFAHCVLEFFVNENNTTHIVSTLNWHCAENSTNQRLRRQKQENRFSTKMAVKAAPVLPTPTSTHLNAEIDVFLSRHTFPFSDWILARVLWSFCATVVFRNRNVREVVAFTNSQRRDDGYILFTDSLRQVYFDWLFPYTFKWITNETAAYCIPP